MPPNAGFIKQLIALLLRLDELLPQEVIIRLILTKCMPILMCGLKACPLNKSVIRSLDFVDNFYDIIV